MPDELYQKTGAAEYPLIRRYVVRMAAGILLMLAACGTGALAASAAPPPPSLGQTTPGGDWQMYNKSLDGQRYSPLSQINISNAATLAEVCRLPVSDQGSFEAGLIVIGVTMYATTATDTIALDARTCTVKWRHHYQQTQNSILQVNRGVTYANGRLFRGTNDARLIALDAATGAELWTDVIGDAGLGELLSGAPVAWNGMVIAGTAVGEFGIRGRVMAFDAATGREIWRFHTIPVGDEIGADTWVNKQWAEHGGGGTWSTFAIDAGTSEVFVPVGNPVPDHTPADRPGKNLFSNSVVALDALSGKVKWWYQTTPDDAWDRDLGAAPVLYRDAELHERVAAAGKDGYVYLINRQTHQLVAKTAVTTVDAKPPVPSTTGVRVCPGVAGGVAWNGPGFDPERQTLFVGAIDYCTVVKSQPGSKIVPGGANNGGTWTPTLDAATGWITAVDAGTGGIRWKYHTEAPVLSGITPTAGGIVLGGDTAGNFLVFDSSNGTLVKKIATGGSLAGGVITYQEAGRQFIAFTSGNISRSVFGAKGRPTIVILALPEKAASNFHSGAAADPVRGRNAFYGMCAICHGADGKNIVLNGRDLTTVKDRMSVEQIIAWIKNPAPPMPKVYPEPLQPAEEQDVRDIAQFLHEWPQ